MKPKNFLFSLLAIATIFLFSQNVDAGVSCATLLVTIGNVDSYVLNVEKPCQALNFKGISTSSTIKVDFESKDQASTNVIPEMTVYKLMSLVNSLQYRGIIEEINELDVITDFVLPFSLNGVLMFDEDNYYKVTIGGITEDSTEVYSLDNQFEGNPLKLIRGDIKSSLTEQTFDLNGIAMLLFSEGAPDKIEHHVNGSDGKLRKVSIDANQIDLMQKEQRITTYVPLTFDDGDANEINVNAFDLGTAHAVVPTNNINSAIIHKTGGEFIFYMVTI